MARHTLLVEVVEREHNPIPIGDGLGAGGVATVIEARKTLEVHILDPDGRRRHFPMGRIGEPLGGHELFKEYGDEEGVVLLRVYGSGKKGRPYGEITIKTPGLYRIYLEQGIPRPLTTDLLSSPLSEDTTPLARILYLCRLPSSIVTEVPDAAWRAEFDDDWAVDRSGEFAIQFAPRPEKNPHRQLPWDRVTRILLRSTSNESERVARLAGALADILFGVCADAKFLEIYDPSDDTSINTAESEANHRGTWAMDKPDPALVAAQEWVATHFSIRSWTFGGCSYLIEPKDIPIDRFPELLMASVDAHGRQREDGALILLPKLHEFKCLLALRRLVRRFGRRLFGRWAGPQQRAWLSGLCGTREAAQYIAEYYPTCRVTRGPLKLVKIRLGETWHYLNFHTRNLGRVEPHADRDREVLEKDVELAALLRLKPEYPSDHSHTLEEELWARATSHEEQAAIWGNHPWGECHFELSDDDETGRTSVKIKPTTAGWGVPDQEGHQLPVGDDRSWLLLGHEIYLHGDDDAREARRKMFERYSPESALLTFGQFWNAAHVVSSVTVGSDAKPAKPTWKKSMQTGLIIHGFLTDGSEGYSAFSGGGPFPNHLALSVPDGETRHFLVAVESWQHSKKRDGPTTHSMFVLGVTVSRKGGKVKFRPLRRTTHRYKFGEWTRFFAEILRVA